MQQRSHVVSNKILVTVVWGLWADRLIGQDVIHTPDKPQSSGKIIESNTTKFNNMLL